MTSFATGINLIDQIVNASLNIDPQKQVLICGRRTTAGVLMTPPSGSTFPMPNLFIPIQLPVFSDGISAVNYLVNNYGFKVVWGVNFSEPLPPPSSISTAQSDGSFIFTWNTIPYVFPALTTISLTGSVVQGSDTGTIVNGSVQIQNNQAFMRIRPNNASVFDTTDPIILSGVNNVQKPNPKLSDEIVVGVFAYYNQATILPTGQTRPNAWISVLNDNCTTITPASTPIALVTPTTVTVNADTSVTLKYPVATVGLGYLPTSSLGASTVTQVGGGSGTYNGYTLDSVGNANINITNVTGTFLTSVGISIALDVTQSYFNFLGNNQINSYVLPFQIAALTDLISTQSAFYNGIQNLNNGYGINQQKFAAIGYYGNLTPRGLLYNLPTPNTQIFKGAWKPDQPTIIDYPETPISIAATSAYLDVNCNTPFYSQANVLLSLSASSNSTTYPTTARNGDCDTATSLGWTVFAINGNSQVYCYRNVTSMVTIPNTSIPDVEFRFMSVWLKQRWLQQQIWASWQQVSTATGLTNGGMILNSSQVQNDFQKSCVTILYAGQKLGMFQKVAQYASQVTVVVDPTLPTGFDVVMPNQVIPELATAKITVQLFSIYYSFTS